VATAYPVWEYLVLSGLGNKNPNDAQLRALNILAQNEGVPKTTNNWLNIESDTPNQWGIAGTVKSLQIYPGNPQWQEGKDPIAYGVWSRPSTGVEIETYPSTNAGVSALVKFLQANHPNIVNALTADNPSATEVVNGFVSDGAWAGDTTALETRINQNGYTPYTGGASVASSSESAAQIARSREPKSFTDCSGNIISFPSIDLGIGSIGGWPILTECEAKAIVGAFTTMLGIAVFAGGLAIIIRNSSDRFDLSGIGEKVSKGGADLLFPKRTQKASEKPTVAAPTSTVGRAPTRSSGTVKGATTRVTVQQSRTNPGVNKSGTFYITPGGRTVRPTATVTQPRTIQRPPAPRPEGTRVPRKEKKLRAKP